jgi:hypothetical protein
MILSASGAARAHDAGHLGEDDVVERPAVHPMSCANPPQPHQHERTFVAVGCPELLQIIPGAGLVHRTSRLAEVGLVGGDVVEMAEGAGHPPARGDVVLDIALLKTDDRPEPVGGNPTLVHGPVYGSRR